MAIFGENNTILGKNPYQSQNPLILAYFYPTNFAKTDPNFNIEKIILRNNTLGKLCFFEVRTLIFEIPGPFDRNWPNK